MKYCALILVIALAGVASLSAQTSSVRNIPPGWIDGAESPNLIPDRVAYRLVFISLMLPDSPDQTAIERQEGHLRQIGLSGADETVLKQALAVFAANYAAWQQTSGTAGEAWNIVQTTQTSLQSRLTSDGNSKFSAYVALAKTHMVVKPRW